MFVAYVLVMMTANSGFFAFFGTNGVSYQFQRFLIRRLGSGSLHASGTHRVSMRPAMVETDDPGGDEGQLTLFCRDGKACDASLQTWLILRASGIPFNALQGPFSGEHVEARTAIVPPIGRLPVLLASDTPIWGVTAVAEFLAELEPSLWPSDPRARAHARAIVGEMVAGLQDLRRLLPLDMLAQFGSPGRVTRGTQNDIQRALEIFNQCRETVGDQGPFLFGTYGIVDAVCTPVASRLVTYGIEMGGLAGTYVDDLLAWPPTIEWLEAAQVKSPSAETAVTPTRSPRERSGQTMPHSENSGSGPPPRSSGSGGGRSFADPQPRAVSDTTVIPTEGADDVSAATDIGGERTIAPGKRTEPASSWDADAATADGQGEMVIEPSTSNANIDQEPAPEPIAKPVAKSDETHRTSPSRPQSPAGPSRPIEKGDPTIRHSPAASADRGVTIQPIGAGTRRRR